ncbi:GDP-mannose 4,6-dehydratase [bacterium]|nr:GDP-mannose 4,6-dehydratase [bacterium]
MTKKALITGVTGQDGSYLAQLLLEKKYQVYGLVRRTSSPTTERIAKIIDEPNFHLVPGDITDTVSLMTAVRDIQPDEVYNLASHSFVHASWDEPIASGEYTAMSVSKILDAVRLFQPKAHFYQASSSEMFGKVREIPQTETTPFYPRSPYGVAKAFGHFLTVNYRESYDMFACSGILFNHESPRRGLEFVTRKIAHQVAQVKLGQRDFVELGNLDAKRDWGYSKDYVQAMWLMLQQEKPDDYVIATGETHTVREFLELAFQTVGIKNWRDHFKHNPEFDRPAEVDLLIGDPTKAKKQLGWQPTVTFEQLVKLMVEAELAILKGEAKICDF